MKLDRNVKISFTKEHVFEILLVFTIDMNFNVHHIVFTGSEFPITNLIKSFVQFRNSELVKPSDDD